VRITIVLLALLARAAAADCPRDTLYPADVPWIPCPSLVTPAPCDRCLAHDPSSRLFVYYDDADPTALVDAIASGLDSSWRVIEHTKDVVAAEAPHRRLYVQATAEKRHVRLYVDSGPR
jgi:hypothetical protein